MNRVHLLAGGALLAALVAFAATFPIRRYAAALRLLDAPNERSSHRVVTPRGGGLAIMLAAALAVFVIGGHTAISATAWSLFGCAAVVGALGAVDDRRGLSPLVRLTVQIAAAVTVVWFTGPVDVLPAGLNGAAPASYAATVLSVLWIATVTNFFNFMDGIDGLACSQAVASCLGIVLAAWSADAAVIAAATGGACLGFLFHNWPPARVFMGDSGSGFLGFVLAALPLLAPRESTASAVVAVAIGLSLFLLDPLITLLRRARAGKHLLQAHREHLYQQLVQPDEPTRKVTTAYFFAGLLLALGGVVGYREPRLFWLGIVMAAAAFGVLWHVVNARSHRRSRTT